MFRLWRRFRAARPDVVIITDLFNDVNLALLCRAARVPLVYSLHTDGSKLPGGVPAAASASQMLTARLATRAATTSQSFAKVLAPRKNLKILQVDVSRRHGSPEAARVPGRPVETSATSKPRRRS